MSLREVLLFLHIVGAFLLVAGAGASTALGVRMGMTTSTQAIAIMSGLQHRVETFVTIPGAVVVIVFGSWLVDEAGYNFADGWIVAAYVVFVLALGLGTGVLTPMVRRLHEHANELVGRGVAESEELRAEADSPRKKIMGMVLNLSFLVFLYLMVAKPGA